MRFLKQNLLVTIFSAILFTALFSSCERNICDNVTCQHGGSCSNGTCLCPTGYEGPQCQTLKTARYLGTYDGYITCDNLADVVDSVTITQSTRCLECVDISMKSYRPKVLMGKVSSNSTVYRILVSNNDTTYGDSSHYFRDFSITLQDDKKLSINIYEELQNPRDSIKHKCNFLSNHKL